MPRNEPSEDGTPKTKRARRPVDISTADPQTAIDTHTTGAITGFADITLAQMRGRGEGPPFFKVGRHVRYILRDVLAWRDARVVGPRAP